MNTRARTIETDPSAATDGAPNDLEADVRTLVDVAAGGGCSIKHMRLVRWRNLKRLLARRWPDIGRRVAATLRTEIAARLGPKGRCVRYDGTSFLVLCPPPGDPALARFDGTFAGEVGAALAGAFGAEGAIEVLKPVAAGNDGLTFAPRPPAPSGKPAATMVLGDALFRYFPLWDIRDDSVFCYLCEAFWTVGDGEPLPATALKAQFDDPKRLLSLDVETLGKASAELDKGLDHYQLAKFLIPVHFRTISDPANAAAYARFCNDRIWAVREFALFEIVDTPADAADEALAVVIERLQPFGAGVMLRVAAGFDRFQAVPADRLLSIGIDLRFDGRPESAIGADIKKFAAAAGAHGFTSHVHGLHTVGPSVIAACAGIDLIGSDSIAEGVDDWRPDEAAGKPTALLRLLAARAKAGRGAG